ncbi:MAG: major capsid protein [Treponema sp.]|jgi:hypothetical protein|nr:major capsid protein [Treponema sp.]
MDLFKKFLLVQALVTTLNRLPPLKTFMMDLIYPEAVRKNHPFDRLAYSDLQLPTKNIPLVTRGSVSYPLTPDTTKISQIDPANFTPSITVSAADINRFRSLSLAGQQTLVDGYIDRLRRSVRKSTEALAIQSTTGKIEYDIRTADGTMDVYVVNFGTPNTVTVSKKWDDPNTKVGDIVASIGQIVDSVQKTSEGTDIVHLIKHDVYAALVTKAAALNNPELIKVFENYVQIGNAKFIICSARYYNYKTKTFVDAIPDGTVRSIARDDAFALFYCALDSLDANFASLPFYVNSVKLDDPEGYKLVGQSRPMPVPNVDAIRETKVLA